MEDRKEYSVIITHHSLFSSSSTQDNENLGLKTTWESKMKQKEERKQLKAKIKQLQDKRNEKREKLKKKLQERRERKKLNEFKSSQYQVIADTKKIRKWNKKARL
jgi:hypothetical protein